MHRISTVVSPDWRYLATVDLVRLVHPAMDTPNMVNSILRELDPPFSRMLPQCQKRSGSGQICCSAHCAHALRQTRSDVETTVINNSNSTLGTTLPCASLRDGGDGTDKQFALAS